MGLTKYYHLAFFDFGDDLTTDLNVRKEVDRFVVIDKQLYGLYNVFGNGVIEGWEVSDNGYTQDEGISISISTGMGIIKYMAAETSLPGYLNNLPPNSVMNIYVVVTGSTVKDRVVKFIYSLINLSPVDQFSVLLAKVTTGDNGVSLIDNTVKQSIGFEQIIQDEIDKHKHRGTPSKIDLQEETKNQLPGARIEGIDVSKIVSGVFDIDRIPIIDHNQLDNSGLLTHAALDSFTKSLSKSNVELLGEISSVNLLKSVIFLKYLYSEVDEHFINELALIPGISPSTFIDFDASTANISLEDNCISGLPIRTGLFTSIYWDDQNDFDSAYFKQDVLITSEGVSLERSGEVIDVLEDFNYSNISPGSDIPNFVKEISSENIINAKLNNATDGKTEGNLGGAFSASSIQTVVYTRDLKQSVQGQSQTQGRDWTEKYDELVFWMKTETLSHGPVYMYLVNGEGTDAVNIRNGTRDWILIEENEVTTNRDETKHNFKEIIIDISNFEALGASNITKMVIYTALDSSFNFSMDNIHVRKRNLVVPTGVIKFRYTAETDVIFHSIFYDIDQPTNTTVKVRVKVASSLDLLDRGSYTEYLLSGSVFAQSGTSAEIEVTLTTSDQTISPILKDLELRLFVSADFNGFTIDNSEEWKRGILENLDIHAGTTIGTHNLLLKPSINVDGYSFGIHDSVSEIDSDNAGVYGFSGSFMPIAPNQAIKWSTNPYRKFDGLTSVIRKYNKNFIIADTKNNRILEVDKDGYLIRGIGSTFSTDSTLYPLSIIYNPTDYKLSIVFSKPVVISDISKIIIYISSQGFSLSSTNEQISTTQKDGRILEVILGVDLRTRLANVTSNLYVNFETGVFTEGITIGANTASLNGLYGMEVFIGDFTYIDNIKHPIFANIMESGNWIIGNSSIIYDPDTDTTQKYLDVPSIVEIDSASLDGTSENLFTSTYLSFSDYTLGSVYEFNENTLISAGLQSTSSSITSAVDLTSEYTEDDPAPERLKFREAAAKALQNYMGVIVIIDKVNNKFQTLYASPDGLYPSDLDLYSTDEMILAESSFIEPSGRIVKLDKYGNIIWHYADGIYHNINDVKILTDNHLVVSI